MKHFIIPGVLLLFISTANLTAQWVQVNNGMGNRIIRALEIDRYNIYAGAYGGIFLSTNNGLSWIQMGLSDQYVISVAVSGSYIFGGTFYFPDPRGVYLSSNSGTNWSQSSLNNREVYSLLINGSSIFAGTVRVPHPGTFPYGVYLSVDNGTSWSQTSLNNRDVFSLEIGGNNLFAGTDSGLFISGNNGISWSQTILNNRYVRSLALNGNNIFAGTSYYGVFLSTNNGTNWVQTSLNNRNVYALAVNGNNIFAGTDVYGIYVSINNGTDWIQRNEGLVNLDINALCIVNNYIFAGTMGGGGLYRRPLSELTGIAPISNEIPKQFSLSQNYPNPFNPATKIKFALPPSPQGEGLVYDSESRMTRRGVRVIVYDILGREVATLVNEQLQPGTYEVEWDATDYPSGVYYYKLIAGVYSVSKKMILVK